MPKKLKLAFAMGGGVSLGTFSGSALTECIKQLIVFGGYTETDGNGNKTFTKYEKIEIDAMSGASAGAMSLAIMLRIFTCYDDVLHLLKETENESPDEIKKKIKERLQKEFGNHYNALSPADQENLFAAQVVQDFQRYLWCNKVSIEALAGMGGGNPNTDLTALNSLLDRGWLEKMATGAVIPKDGDTNFSSSKRKLLADRVLFACTLTRVEPIALKTPLVKGPFESEEVNKLYSELYEVVLKDAVNSHTHRDLRVFDLNYTAEPEKIKSKLIFPERWISAVKGSIPESVNSNRITLSIDEKHLWSHVVATSIAAGTFPFAFEPVPLTRYNSEYSIPGDGSKVYTYVDGGTLNNEPISEAFRLSAVLDSNDNGVIGKDFDRYVFFVDPFIDNKEPVAFRSYNRQFKHEIHENPQRFAGFFKLAAFAPYMVSILRNEGSISELDKAITVLNKFDNRDKLKSFYSQTIDKGLPRTVKQVIEIFKVGNESNEEVITRIRDEVKNVVTGLKSELNAQYKRQVIPNISLTIESEIRRVIIDPENAAFFRADKDVLDYLNSNPIDRANNENNEIVREFYRFFDEFEIEEIKYFNTWIKSLFFAYIELVMDLSGKSDKTILVPVGPLTFDGQRFSPLTLEGEKIAGFYGFFDIDIRYRDFDKGIYAAVNVLSALKLINREPINAPVTTSSDLIKTSDDKVKKVLVDVVKKRLIEDILLNNILGSDSAAATAIDLLFRPRINRLIENWAGNTIEGVKSVSLVMKIKVPDNDYQIKGFGSSSDIDVFESGGGDNAGQTLIFVQKAIEQIGGKGYNWKIDEDSEAYIRKVGGYPCLEVVKDRGFLPSDKAVITLPLPAASQISNAVSNFSSPVFIYDLTDGKSLDVRKSEIDQFLKNGSGEIWKVESTIVPLEITLAQGS